MSIYLLIFVDFAGGEGESHDGITADGSGVDCLLLLVVRPGDGDPGRERHRGGRLLDLCHLHPGIHNRRTAGVLLDVFYLLRADGPR